MANRFSERATREPGNCQVEPPVIVVLGGHDQIDRAHRASRLYRSREDADARVLLTGTESECRAMFETLVIDGVATAHIVVDPRSKNTRDNAKYTNSTTAGWNVDTLWVVTSDFQVARVRFLFRRQFDRRGVTIHHFVVKTHARGFGRLRLAYGELRKWGYDVYRLYVENRG